MTEGYFKEQLQRIDSLCEVDFEVVQYGIHVRPSHPRYRDALVKRALELRPAGAVLYEVVAQSWWHWLLRKLRPEPEHHD